MIYDIWTIELNLDEDCANSCSFHIDSLKNTILRNIKMGINKETGDRWALVGLAYGIAQAHKKCEKLHKLLCNISDKKPYGISELIDPDFDPEIFNRRK